jgi:large subunit ribosomal protein L21
MYSNFPVTGRKIRVGCGEVKIGENMLYAIVENGGKQYKAVEGNYIEVDLLPEEVGKKKTFDKILLLADDGKVEVGTPFLAKVSVDATVVEHFKGPKIVVFKYRAKQRYRVKTGHRQKYTRVLVDSIAFPGKTAKPVKKEAAKEEPKAEKKPAAKKTTAAKPKASTAKKSTAKSSTAKKSTTKKAAPAKKASTAKKTTTAAKKPAAAKKTTSTAKKTTAAKKSTTAKKSTAAKKTSTTKKSTDKK